LGKFGKVWKTFDLVCAKIKILHSQKHSISYGSGSSISQKTPNRASSCAIFRTRGNDKSRVSQWLLL